MSKADVYKEINKYQSQKILAEGRLIEAKDTYRIELVKECISNLSKLLKDNGELSERDFKIFINDLSLDVRDIYLNKL